MSLPKAFASGAGAGPTVTNHGRTADAGPCLARVRQVHEACGRPARASDRLVVLVCQTKTCGKAGRNGLAEEEREKEIVAGWEWDDGNAVHRVGEVAAGLSIAPTPAQRHLAAQLANILHALGYADCACAASRDSDAAADDAKGCVIRAMERVVLPPPPPPSPTYPTYAPFAMDLDADGDVDIEGEGDGVALPIARPASSDFHRAVRIVIDCAPALDRVVLARLVRAAPPRGPGRAPAQPRGARYDLGVHLLLRLLVPARVDVGVRAPWCAPPAARAAVGPAHRRGVDVRRRGKVDAYVGAGGSNMYGTYAGEKEWDREGERTREKPQAVVERAGGWM
ncbi:hypothetical protein DFH09DRAFT_1336396 [Mycena vulgaris]|nr:hypothetical protein DFH09DRAFT_1336396 [Mycena vulgaris]